MNRILLSAMVALGLGACSPQVAQRASAPRVIHPHTVKTVKVEHFTDGRYAYEDNSGIWWWYYITMTSETQRPAGTPIGSGYYTGSASGLTTQAVAGRGAQPTEEEEASEEAVEVDLDVMSNGQPAIETENEGQSESDVADGASPGEGAGGSADGGSGGGDGGGGDGGGGGGD